MIGIEVLTSACFERTDRHTPERLGNLVTIVRMTLPAGVWRDLKMVMPREWRILAKRHQDKGEEIKFKRALHLHVVYLCTGCVDDDLPAQ